MTGRAIRNEFSLAASKQIPIKSCEICLKVCKRNYCIIDALSNAQQGNLKKGLIFCGERVAEINKIQKVSEVIKELKDEFEEARRKNKSLCQNESLLPA